QGGACDGEGNGLTGGRQSGSKLLRYDQIVTSQRNGARLRALSSCQVPHLRIVSRNQAEVGAFTVQEAVGMPRNVTQKLIAAHLADGEMRAGEPISIRIDQTLTQDATGTLVMLALEAIG